MGKRLETVFDDIHTLHRNKCAGELFTRLLKAKEIIEKLQEQGNLLTYGLLQERQKTSALLEACEFAKSQIKKGSQKKALPILRAAIAKAKLL